MIWALPDWAAEKKVLSSKITIARLLLIQNIVFLVGKFFFIKRGFQFIGIFRSINKDRLNLLRMRLKYILMVRTVNIITTKISLLITNKVLPASSRNLPATKNFRNHGVEMPGIQ